MYKVFIADDESLVIKSLKASVDWLRYGFEVIGEANDGEEAFHRILQLHPDIVFTDIRMPGMNGLELIRKVSELSVHTLFVVISGYAEFEYAQKALNYGALGYCLKPFDEVEIAQILVKARAHLDMVKNSPEYVGTKPEHISTAYRNETFRNILHYVNEHYCEEISIQHIAKAFAINSCYISQLFKKETGETFTEYLTRLRIDHACTLLKTTSLNVNEIACKTGFSDYFYFTRVFKKVTGKTPTYYRNKKIK